MSRHAIDNSMPHSFLQRAIQIYRKMMDRRYDIPTLFSKISIRSKPEALATLESFLAKRDNASPEEFLEKINGAIATEEEQKHKKFPLILKIARIPYELISHTVVIDNIALIERFTAISAQIKKDMEGDDTNTETFSIRGVFSGVSSWVGSFVQDSNFYLEAMTLLNDVSHYSQTIFIGRCEAEQLALQKTNELAVDEVKRVTIENKTKYQEVQDQYDSLFQELESNRREVTLLRSTVAVQKSTLKKVGAECDQIRTEKENLEKNLAKSQLDLEALQRENRYIIEAAETRHKQLEEEQDKLRQEYKEKQTAATEALEKFQSKLEALEEEKTNITAEHAVELRRLQLAKAELQQEYAQKQEAAEAQIQESQLSLEALQQEHANTIKAAEKTHNQLRLAQESLQQTADEKLAKFQLNLQRLKEENVSLNEEARVEREQLQLERKHLKEKYEREAKEKDAEIQSLLEERDKKLEDSASASEEDETQEILYKLTRKEFRLITNDVVERLEEYMKADFLFQLLMERVDDNREYIDEDDYEWAQDMFRRFWGVYRLIFDNLNLDEVTESINREYPKECLVKNLKIAKHHMMTAYRNAIFYDSARNSIRTLEGINPQSRETQVYQEKLQKKSGAEKAMAAFSEEFTKRIENIEKGRVVEIADLAGAFAQRNKMTMQRHAEKALTKEIRQRQQPPPAPLVDTDAISDTGVASFAA